MIARFRPTGMNVVRIACGAFLFPHVFHLMAGPWSPSAGAVIFFTRAGFYPPDAWVRATAFAEVIVGAALVLGAWTRYAAPAAAALLFVAIYALHEAKGLLWRDAGYEYALFWAVACIAVALDAWQDAWRNRSA